VSGKRPLMREIEAKRTRFSKTFDLGNGQRRLEIGQLPCHFERDGKLHDIDLTPRWDASRGQHVIRDCPYSLRISDDVPAYAYNSMGGKRVSVTLDVPPSKAIVDGGLFKWAEVGRDTDYVIQPLPAGCATLLILNGPDAPRTWSWRIDGNLGLIRPLVGKDSAGRLLELVETRDAEAGTIVVEWTGQTLRPGALRLAKRAAWTEEVTWPVVIDPTVNENIAAGGDDAISFWSGSGATFGAFNATYTGLNAGRTGTLRVYAGLRFQTLAVPVAATIDSATLTIRTTTLGGTPNINIYGNDVDDAAVWADPGNRIKNITQTSAVVNKADWTGSADNAVSVAAIVSEIVARAGWASGNDIAFGLFNNAGAGDHLLNFAALEHATLTEARLSIDYTAAGSVSQTAIASSTTDTATPTFSAQAIGADGGSDVIYIGAGCRSTADASTMTCTVDGVSADQIVFRSFDEGGGVRSNCAMFAINRDDLPDPAQTDVDIALTHNQVAIRHAIAVAVSPNASKTAFATASQANASNDLSLNTPAGGIAIGFLYNGEISTITWTGLTETSDLDVAAEGANRFGTAYASAVAAATPRTITGATGVDLSAKVAASFALASAAVAARFVGTNLTASRFLNPRSLVKH
jgi:hypothetical protein